jgi:endonuclease IV
MAKKGKTAAALDIFNWGLQQYPDDYWLTYHSGSVHKQRGEIDTTRTVWQKCQQILEKTRADIGEERYGNRTRGLKEEMEKLEK